MPRFFGLRRGFADNEAMRRQRHHVGCAMLLLLMLLMHPLRVHTVCLGVTECNCEPGFVINCRNADLTAVPSFDLSGSLRTNYSELTLAGNRITSMPALAFRGLQFRRLDLSDNPLIRLNSSAFSGLERHLHELKLTLSSEAEFPAPAIRRLTRLRVLYVSGFGARQLPTAALETLSQLVELGLISGSLTTLNPNDLRAQHGSLQTLVLHSNELSGVPTTALSTVTMLSTLDLSRNQISTLPADVFAGLINLAVVDLSNNGLGGGGGVDAGAFRAARRLRTLTMKSCQLGDRDVAALRQLHSIIDLILSYNNIANLPADLFNRMRSLRQLRLDNNQLQTITRSTFSAAASTLEVLDLGHNPLSAKVPEDAFVDLNYLHELRLDGVTTLQLSAGSFSSRHRRVLRTLSVPGSGIGDRLWPIVSRLEKLNSLFAARASISSIPDFAFRRNSALQTIDLSSNAISALTQRSVYGLADSLAAINLHDNRITTIDPCTFYQFSSSFDYFKLGLGANPLRCDCDIHWLYSLLRVADSFRLGGLAWTCDGGTRFAQLTDVDFDACPPSQYNCSLIVPPYDDDDQRNNSTDPDDHLPLVLRAYNLSESACLLEWTVSADAADDVAGFIVSVNAVLAGSSTDGGTSPFSVTAPASSRRLRLTDLHPATEYTICISMTRDTAAASTGGGGTHVCTSVWTNPASEQPERDEYARLLAVILGSIFGATLLLVVVAVVVVLLRRYYARRTREKAQAAIVRSNSSGLAPRPRSATARPQVGYGSKRFAKNGVGAPKRRPLATVSGGDTQGQTSTTSAAFTPDERAQILAMLAGTPAFTAPRAFANAAYEPGGSFGAESNDHVYDAIVGGEGLYDVPLDSPV